MDIECVRWIAILAIVCLDIDGKANIGIKVVISGRRIVIDIELAVVSILDRVGHDHRHRIIVGTSRLVPSMTVPERKDGASHYWLLLHYCYAYSLISSSLVLSFSCISSCICL